MRLCPCDPSPLYTPDDASWEGWTACRSIRGGRCGGIDMKPTYDELVLLLRQAPPRQMIDDQRYWDWRTQVEAMLARVEE